MRAVEDEEDVDSASSAEASELVDPLATRVVLSFVVVGVVVVVEMVVVLLADDASGFGDNGLAKVVGLELFDSNLESSDIGSKAELTCFDMSYE